MPALLDTGAAYSLLDLDAAISMAVPVLDNGNPLPSLTSAFGQTLEPAGFATIWIRPDLADVTAAPGA